LFVECLNFVAMFGSFKLYLNPVPFSRSDCRFYVRAEVVRLLLVLSQFVNCLSPHMGVLDVVMGKVRCILKSRNASEYSTNTL
jgi:hypothetical protein